MTVVSLTTMRLKPGVSWDEAQKHIKRGNDLCRKHGGENVTLMAGMAAGEATGMLCLLYTAPDWASFGQVQDRIMADPEMVAVMTDPNSPVSGWQTYLNQTIPDV
jgi:hypothetical protein